MGFDGSVQLPQKELPVPRFVAVVDLRFWIQTKIDLLIQPIGFLANQVDSGDLDVPSPRRPPIYIVGVKEFRLGVQVILC
jgi:hypothetical protein